MIIAERGFDLRLFPRTFHAEDHKENPPTELVLFRGVVRGVAGVARATPIFQVLFQKT